jgi:hypothetical protein
MNGKYAHSLSRGAPLPTHPSHPTAPLLPLLDWISVAASLNYDRQPPGVLCVRRVEKVPWNLTRSKPA